MRSLPAQRASPTAQTRTVTIFCFSLAFGERHGRRRVACSVRCDRDACAPRRRSARRRSARIAMRAARSLGPASPRPALPAALRARSLRDAISGPPSSGRTERLAGSNSSGLRGTGAETEAATLGALTEGAQRGTVARLESRLKSTGSAWVSMG